MSKTVTRKLRVFALLALALVSYAEAKEACPPTPTQPTAEQVQAAAKNARDRGFLWRITKDGRSSYLYGTMHIAKFEWMFPGPKVMNALRSSDTVALELDVLDPDIKGRMQESMKALRVTALPDPLQERVKKLAASVCVPYDQVAKFPPELQVGMLSMLIGRWDELEPEYAIDALLSVAGHRAKKQVVSLETPESQLAQLQMETPADTIAIVKDSLDDLDRDQGHVYLVQAAQSWANSDYAKMADFEKWCNCLNTDIERKMMKRMLDERQAPMADAIDALHKSGKKVFAAVGSLHMFGPLGLPTLMEKKGYKVERVEFK